MNEVNEASPARETSEVERVVKCHSFAINIDEIMELCEEYLTDKEKIGKGIPLHPYVVRELLRRAGYDC